MTQIKLHNRLDDSNGSIKVTHNNAMQPASQTTESSATAKKGLLSRIGLLAILAIGVDAAASFLKSQMEKAAAIASQVGAAVLKSKKAAAAILVGLLPEPPKKARLMVSAPILALLAGIFSAQPQAMAQYPNYGPALPVGTPLPYYDKKVQKKDTLTFPPIFLCLANSLMVLKIGIQTIGSIQRFFHLLS